MKDIKIGVITQNKGSHKTTHPFKLTITCNKAKKQLKDYYGYQMFCWVFETEAEAVNSLQKDIKLLF